MALKVEMVTFDCSDPAKLAGWWAEQFDGTTRELLPGEFVVVARTDGPRLGFQKVPDPPLGKTACTSTSRPRTWMPRCCAWSPPEPVRSGGIRSARAFAGWCWLTPKATLLRGGSITRRFQGAEKRPAAVEPVHPNLNSAMALPIVAGQPE